MAFAFSTATSNATIPLSIDTLHRKMGVSKKISSFTIPLGATINMDGTAIMQGVAVVFAAQAFHIQLSAADFLTVIATATLASIGGAALMVDCMTDNKTRTVADVRHAFNKHGGNLGTEGSVSFMFKHIGEFVFAPGVTTEDAVMEIALEAGADDVIE